MTEIETETDLRSLPREEAAETVRRLGLSPGQVSSARLPVRRAETFVAATDDFVCGNDVNQGRIRIRWSSVDTYKVVIDGQDLLAKPPLAVHEDASHYLG